MSNVRADWQPVFLWPLPTDSSLPLSHSHQPIPIPTDLCPLPSSRILRALPPSGGPPRYSIFSLSFHSSFSPFLPPFVALSPGDLIFRRKSKRRMLRDRHRQFPPSSCKKTWKRIHTHEHTGHGDTGDTYLFCIQSDTHSLACRTRSNRVKYLS